MPAGAAHTIVSDFSYILGYITTSIPSEVALPPVRAPAQQEDGMFNVRPQIDWPMFRVKPQDEVPGFRVDDTGSVPAGLTDARLQSVSHSPYGSPSVGLTPPPIDFLSGLPGQAFPGTEPYPAPQQVAAALSCAEGHRACVNSGRLDGDCLRAFHNCSRFGNGLPTIFAPGIWGRPK